MLHYVVLVKVCEENLASHRCVFGKRRSILIAFPDDYGYPSLIEYQNSASGGFLKISCNMKFEIISMKFAYSVTLKFTILKKKIIYLPFTLNEHFTRGFCILSIGHLENLVQ